MILSSLRAKSNFLVLSSLAVNTAPGNIAVCTALQEVFGLGKVEMGLEVAYEAVMAVLNLGLLLGIWFHKESYHTRSKHGNTKQKCNIKSLPKGFLLILSKIIKGIPKDWRGIFLLSSNGQIVNFTGHSSV